MCRCAMNSMKKCLLVTTSAIILAKVASASLEIDAKENKAIINKTEFNKKISELNPPSLVIPPFSSAKDYKRLASICFLGIGDCDKNAGYGKGDTDYIKGCDPINPCTGFNDVTTACTEGYTTCNTGCETKYKCKPPEYTETCSSPYQGVGSPINGKYKECECESQYIYGTGTCSSPQVPDTSGTSCDGKYASCTCPTNYTETCTAPYLGVGESCNGKYTSCTCPDSFTLTCEGQTGDGESCNGKYEACTDLPCTDRGFTETCDAPYIGVGDVCEGKYASCQCPANYNQNCSTNASMVGVGTPCDGLYAECKCKPIYNKTCTAPMIGVNGCEDLFESCQCPSSYKTCSAPLTGVGTPCDGKYATCKCDTCVTCSAPEVGVGGIIFDGKYAACKCPAEFNEVCKGNEVCDSSSSCGGLCSSCYVPSTGGGVTPPPSGGGGGGGGGYSPEPSPCPSFICW